MDSIVDVQTHKQKTANTVIQIDPKTLFVLLVPTPQQKDCFKGRKRTHRVVCRNFCDKRNNYLYRTYVNENDEISPSVSRSSRTYAPVCFCFHFIVLVELPKVPQSALLTFFNFEPLRIECWKLACRVFASCF